MKQQVKQQVELQMKLRVKQKNDAVSRRVLQPVARRTMSACGPFWPCEISKSTR